jgi:hypothetical protein
LIKRKSLERKKGRMLTGQKCFFWQLRSGGEGKKLVQEGMVELNLIP